MAGPDDKLVSERTEYDSRGAHHYSTYEDEDGNRYEEHDSTESRNDLLGFDDDEHFEDNML